MLVFFFLPVPKLAKAQSTGLILEWEQHWETYGVGGCCNFGTHNFFVGDVDGDGVLEMLTGGIMYYVNDDNRTGVEAPFRIWNWNGEKFNLEMSANWPGAIVSIYAADSDSDGSTEIILGGRAANTTGSYASLKILNWNGEILTIKASYEGVSVNSIFVSDVDGDGTAEILTVGSASNEPKSSTKLVMWHCTDNELVLKASIEWSGENGARANSVYALDLNNDGEVEIITAGYANDVQNSRGQICIWHLYGDQIFLEESEEWCTVENGYGLDIAGNPLGNTVVNNLKVEDIDGDGFAEIITGGFAYDGENIDAQLRIWNWSDQNLMVEKSIEWATEDITEVKSISINDVDGDGYKDIVTSGFIGVYGGFTDENTAPEQAQLRIWSWDGKVLTLKIDEAWVIGDGVTGWNIGTGDVDDDGTTEIVTVGCMYESDLCDPDLRVWSMSKISTQFSAIFLATLVVITFLIVIGVFYFFKVRKGTMKTSK